MLQGRHCHYRDRRLRIGPGCLTDLVLVLQYDASVSTFSPDGRIFQVEYAQKAVDNSG